MKNLLSLAAVSCLFFVSACGSIALDAGNLTEPARLNSAGEPGHTVIKSFKINDKAGWILSLFPVNKPAGDKHQYLAEILQKQINDAGGDAVINVKIRAQYQFIDILVAIGTGGIYNTRTVTITGDVIKYYQ